MKVADLIRATRIWDLAVLDTGARGLTFTPEHTSFEGLHCSARFTLLTPLLEGKSDPVIVIGKTLNASLSLLEPEDEIDATVHKGKIGLVSGSRQVVITTAKGSDYRPRVKKSELEAAPKITIDRINFLEVLNFVMQAIANDMSNPVLNGVQVEYLEKGICVMRSTNGNSRAAVARAAAKGDPLKFVLSPADFATALGCMEDDEVTLGLVRGIVVLYDARTYIELATLAGEFPDLSKLATKFKSKVTIPASVIDLITRASITFDTDRLATLRIAKGMVSVLARGEERGAFRAVVAGAKGEDIDLTFDAILLGAATYLGKKVTIQFTNNTSTVLMTGDPGKYFWLSPIMPRD